MFAYRFLLIVLSPLLAGYILWQSASRKSLRYFRQRLGFAYAQLPKNRLWFHCASVGEVNTLLPLLRNLHLKNPQLKFLITTNTITGGKIVTQQNLEYLAHSYLPFDWASCISRFINTLNPAALYVMETEIWPNLFRVCHSKNITIHIINARLSEKTTTAKPWIKSLLKSALSKVSFISARSKQDAHAYELLGADKNSISATGNLKLTTVLNDFHSSGDSDIATDRKYVLVASTHENEELQIYTIWKNLARDELLIIAPRHPERASTIIKNLRCPQLASRSKNQPITEQTKVYLLDTVGELKNYFNNAELVIMGGSFVPVGGHNILEPAGFNAAIITGPYMDNFREELKMMLDKNAIAQVDSYPALATELKTLLDDDDYRASLQHNASELTHDAEAILDRYTAIILEQTMSS